MFDWDDLRYFIAAARTGSLTAAARHLGVDAATVGRRISRLESRLKSTLLVRSARGLQLTSVGARLWESGLDAEAAMLQAERSSGDDIVGGSVRISASEGFGTVILAPALPAFCSQRPGLNIELAANSGFLSPSRREVDMAVTLSAPTQARLVAEPLTDYQLGLYSSQAYLDQAPELDTVEALGQHALVGYIDDLIYVPELRYLDELGVRLRRQISSSSIRAQREIIVAGGGIGVLPCFMARGLAPVLGDKVRLTRRFWMSTHADVARTARMRAVRRWLVELVSQHSAELNPYG